MACWALKKINCYDDSQNVSLWAFKSPEYRRAVATHLSWPWSLLYLFLRSLVNTSFYTVDPTQEEQMSEMIFKIKTL